MGEQKKVTQLELIEKVDSKIKLVRTRSLDLSFNELLDMYKNGEFEINPEYQRLFRWSEEKQSRFIESLILEMPIPPIYVIEKEEGIYELIDGLQRISSYLHFRGALDKYPEEVKYLKLTDCDIVKELNGYTFNDLPKVLQIKLKRNFIRVEVIRRGSDQRLRYYMFKRLNTGGELLSEQEIRNCTIRLLDDTFNNFIIQMSQDINFKKCMTYLSDEKRDQKYDQEYVLRFFAFKNNQNNYQKDIAPFITAFMEGVSYPSDEPEHIAFDYKTEESIFKKTFTILNESLGEYAFARVNQNGNWVASVSPNHFDAFTLGIQPYLNDFNPNDKEQMEELGSILKAIKEDESFLAYAKGGGKNTKRFLERRINIVKDKVGDWLNERRKNS